MAEKILNTRLQLKYDTYANWTGNNPVLKAGEMAVATVANNETNVANTGFTNLPNVVLKVGDGVSHYNDLKFVSALAADVHGWAKNANKPTYGYAEIEGLEQYIKDVANAEIKDTDTQYTIAPVEGSTYKFTLKSKGLDDAAWTDVAEIDLSKVGERLTALEGLVGTTKVSDQIATAINGLNAAEVKAGQGEILEAVSEAAGVVTVTKRALVKEDIPTIDQAQVDGLGAALEAAAKAGTDAADKALADAKTYADEQIDVAVQALDYTDPNYVEGQFVTKVTEVDGVIAVERAAVGIANVTGLETRLGEIEQAIEDADGAKQDVVEWDDDAEYDPETNKAATMGSITNAINALDKADEAVAHQFVTAVSEEDGIVTVVRAQPVVADIAGLEEDIDAIYDEIDTKQDALTFTSAPNDSNNRVATEQFVLESVADLNGAMHFVGTMDAVPGAEANDQYEAGDVILVGYDEYVFDGNEWKPLGNESIYKSKEEAKTEHEALQKAIDDGLKELDETKQDNLVFAGDYSETNPVMTDSAVDELIAAAIDGLDKADEAVAGQLVSAVSEENGVITVARRALVAGDFADDVVPEAAVAGLTEKLEQIQTDASGAIDEALAAAKEYTDAELKTAIEGLDKADEAVEGQFVTAVVEADGIITVSRAALKATDIPVIEQTQVNGLAEALEAAAKAGTDAAAQALVDAKAYTDTEIDTAIQALDKTDEAVEKQVVTAVSQEDGIVAVTRAQLADVAWTGNVNDLLQTEGDVLVFDCGSSTKNI